MMHNTVSLVALPKQDLMRPPAALPILAAACADYNINHNIYDFNLWLHRNVDRSTWNDINDNWETANPLDQSDTSYYATFLQKLKSYVDLILENNPTLIAVSLFSDLSAVCAYELIKELNLRPTRNQFKIVIGGTGIRARFSVFNHAELCLALLEYKLIDFYIFGEGEIAFRKLLTGEITYPGINNFNAIQIDDLDQFSFPDYSKMPPNSYDFFAEPQVTVTGSKGCVRACTYCDVAKYWPKFRYRKGQKIADELYYYYKTLGITSFEFSDSLINGSLKQFKEMNLALIEYQKIDPTFKINYKGQYICRSVSAMKEQDYANMKKAGCDYLYVGVESFNDQVRFDMDKKFTNEDLEHHLKMCGRYNIKNSFLMLIGYPTETLEHHQENIEKLKKYQSYAKAGIISMIVFGYTGGILEDTPLYHQMSDIGIVPEYESNNEFDGFNWINLSNPELTLKERIRRWIELTELASTLGYLMPRNRHYILKFISLLEKKKQKKLIKIAV